MLRTSIRLGVYSLLCCLLILCASVANGQTGTSSVRGTITDAQGKPVPHATVTLTNVAINATRTMQSSANGEFVFDLITPGDYRLEVEAQGFSRKRVENVKALIGKPTESNVELSVGVVTQTVEVTIGDQANLINTQDASLGNNFESNQITQLPLEGRNVVDLLSLQPGATREGYVTGARADQSNVTLDGVDVNNAQTGNAQTPMSTNNLVIGGLVANITDGPVLRLNSEAIEEFRVTTANGGAEQGRSSGAQVNLVTKSGTNQFHGAAFEFYRGTPFEANDRFSNAAGVPRTPLVRNTFGGAIGGPILKDKLFFFYSYEGRRDATATGVSRIVPLPSLGQGIINYTYCADAACNTRPQASLDLEQNQQVYADAGINQAALSALADAASKYPSNDFSTGDNINTGGYRFNAPTPIKLNSNVVKLDYTLNSKQNIFGRLNMMYDHQIEAQWFPDTPAPQIWSHPWGLAAGHTWSIGQNWVNSFRYGYTRQAYSQAGDSDGNDISFRFVFQPNGQLHTLSRVTPVQNITDDISWIHGRHTVQFGGNVRIISNTRVSYANAFDNAITNPSFYFGSGAVTSNDFQAYLSANGLPGDQHAGQKLDSTDAVQSAATAIIGRFSQYTADFTFNKAGELQAPGVPTTRDFATQAYDMYIQDAWKIRPTLTLTMGLRYSLERPVYETQGYQVQPEVGLGKYFQQRIDAANQGTNFTDPIVINLSGPANGGKPMYNWDKNNFQPRIAVAWSPNFSSGLLHSLFGNAGQSVIRGGFALTNDYYGQALAVDWDLNNTLGFTSNYTTPANTYESNGTNLAPLFTGFNQDIRTLPNVVVPENLTFPQSQPLDEGERIEQGVDSNLHSPVEYVWNVTLERQFRGGITVAASYIGRSARGLLARQDIAAFNNIRDPKSGMTWYEAGTILEKQRQKNVDTSQIASIPFFDNLFPANLVELFNTDPNIEAGFPSNWTPTQVFYGMQSRGQGQSDNTFAFFTANDWTDAEAQVDNALFDAGLPTRFMQQQYGTLSSWSTIGNSNYNAFTFSVRQRLSSLTFDFNYTYSHSLDDASGLQSEGGFGNNTGNGAFIVNPLRQRDSYSNSDFDIRHLINVSAVWQLPFGKGRTFMNTQNKAVQAILGGWQISGIYRWNTGLPMVSPFDAHSWATNWDFQSANTATRPFSTCPSSAGTPKLFGGSACDIKAIYQSFRNAYPGETGPRNYLRLPGYMNVDLGLAKTFTMPWSEKQQLQLRWDVFNVANLQRFGLVDASRTGIGIDADAALQGLNPPDNWSNFTQIQGQPRVMQIGARFSF